VKVYLDTSVPSAYFDDRAPERRSLTLSFWPTLAAHDVYISDLVLTELGAVSDDGRREALLAMVRGFAELDSGADRVEALADAYVTMDVIPPAARPDALHVAVAVVHGMEVVLSWNLRHLVRLRTRRGVNAINTLRGLGPIEILTPPEL
jgi:predicted nucleic acid-binding protein